MSGGFGRGNEEVGGIPPTACIGAYGVAGNAQRYWELGEYSALYQDLVDFMMSVLDGDQIPFEIRCPRFEEPHQLFRSVQDVDGPVLA